MADSVRKVQYVYVMVPNRPGQGAKILLELQEAKIDLQAYGASLAGRALRSTW